MRLFLVRRLLVGPEHVLYIKRKEERHGPKVDMILGLHWEGLQIQCQHKSSLHTLFAGAFMGTWVFSYHGPMF